MIRKHQKLLGKRRGWNETQTHSSWFQICHAMVFKHEDASGPAMNGVISTKTVFYKSDYLFPFTFLLPYTSLNHFAS